jgi:hypothetical protein
MQRRESRKGFNETRTLVLVLVLELVLDRLPFGWHFNASSFRRRCVHETMLFFGACRQSTDEKQLIIIDGSPTIRNTCQTGRHRKLNTKKRY